MDERNGAAIAQLLTLLQEGYTALEDRDWERAEDCFTRVTAVDESCAEAWFGRALAELECASVDEFLRARQRGGEEDREMLPACEPNEERVSDAVERLRVPGYFDEREIREIFGREAPQYPSVTPARRKRLAMEREYWTSDPLISRAAAYAEGDLAATLRDLKEKTLASLAMGLASSEKRDRERAEKVKSEYEVRLDAAEQEAERRSRLAERRREEDYAAACEAQERAASPDELRAAAEAFAPLGRYRDSRKRAQQCREEAESRERTRGRRLLFSKLKTIVLGIAALIAVVGVLVLYVTKITLPRSRYASAEALLAAGDYNGAAKAFAALGDYRDSAALALNSAHEAMYQDAEALLAAGNHEAAAAKFRLLGEYSDSALRAQAIEQWLLQRQYDAAEALLEEGDYDRAAVGFRRLGEYSDSALRALEAQYRAAEQLLLAGDYDGAILRFELLEDYGDSAQRIEEARELKQAAEEAEEENGT